MKLPVNYEELKPHEKRPIREAYVEQQDGKCHYCEQPLDGLPAMNVLAKKINWNLFPKGFTKYPVHLHHDHNTGMTVGAVHAYCNAVLWQYHGE